VGAEHRRREVWVGRSTIKAILGSKLVPGFADWYLGRTGFKSQQTSDLVGPDRPSNLFEPVSGMHVTHGIFDEKATASSPEVWLSEHRSWLAGATAVGAAGLALAVVRR
jgi:hypothetical protein